MNKRCMKCGKPANFKFVKIDKSQVFDMYFCQEHAAEQSPYQKNKIPLSEILANFLSQEQAGGETSQEEAGIKCQTCGLPFDSYRKTLLLGCPDCYVSFEEQLLPDLRKFHGSTRHVGRRPGGEQETRSVPERPPAAKAKKEKEKDKEKEKEKSKKAEPASATQGGAALLTDPQSAIKELTTAMNKAIADEDFEKAALCRDQIKEFRALLKQKEGKK